MPKVNPKYKDTLFRMLFGEYKEYALALYNAINKTNYKDVEDLKIITLEDALYIDIKNDVGYIFHDAMTLIEHQSTYNPNMPLRGLGYFSDTYTEYISETYGSAKAIYSDRTLSIPAPKFYVLYNGRKDYEDVELRLSNLYNGEGDVEVVAHMININLDRNQGLLDACEPLKGYATLINLVREYRSAGYSDEEASMMAVDRCIEEGILADILRKERDKVSDFLYRGLTEEEKKELEKMNLEYALERGIEQGIKQGIDIGTSKTKLADIDAFVSKDIVDAETACNVLSVSVDDYNAYKAGVIE